MPHPFRVFLRNGWETYRIPVCTIPKKCISRAVSRTGAKRRQHGRGSGRQTCQHARSAANSACARNGQPRPETSPGRGCRCAKQFGKRTCKPNSVVCGHSSRRRVAADTHQRPTRRFRQLLRAAWAHRADAQRRMARCRRFPPYLVLLRVGFTLPPALPPERCALTAPFHPYPGAEAASGFRVALPKEG